MNEQLFYWVMVNPDDSMWVTSGSYSEDDARLFRSGPMAGFLDREEAMEWANEIAEHFNVYLLVD